MAGFRIDHRFCGPPDSGNGGYVAGMLAQALGCAACQVTLQSRPPLDRDLEVRLEPAGAGLFDGDTLVASAVPSAVEFDVPRPPTMAAAIEAERRYTGFEEHVFPTCFVCGPGRSPGDGLRIFAGALDDGTELFAATWRPDASLGDDDGLVRPEFVWAALDCPGYFAVQAQAGPALLGRMVAHVFDRPRVGEPLIVTAWPVRHEGRKHYAGTALHSANGALFAAARETWISIPG